MTGKKTAAVAWAAVERAFKSKGFDVFAGVRACMLPDAAKTYADYVYMSQNGKSVPANGGLSPFDLVFFESLSQVYHPENIILLSNDFGWNALNVAKLFQPTRLIELRGQAENGNTAVFQHVTSALAADLGLPYLPRTGRGSDAVPFVSDPLNTLILDTCPEGMGSDTLKMVEALACMEEPRPTVILWVSRRAFDQGTLIRCREVWGGANRCILRSTSIGLVLMGDGVDHRAQVAINGFVDPWIRLRGFPSETPPIAKDNLISRLVGCYRKAGCEITIGIDHSEVVAKDLYFAHIYDAERQAAYLRGELPTMYRELGGGCGILDLYLFECIAKVFAPRNILVIGNAFGWSTVALSLIFPDAKVVAIDNLSGGSDSEWGFDLTREIVNDLGVESEVVSGESPGDVSSVVERHLLGPIDFAFIDGLHTTAQQDLDYRAVKAHLASSAVICFHDVVTARMVGGFQSIAQDWRGQARILARTPSGQGCLYTDDLIDSVGTVVDSFCEAGVKYNAAPQGGSGSP